MGFAGAEFKVARKGLLLILRKSCRRCLLAFPTKMRESGIMPARACTTLPKLRKGRYYSSSMIYSMH